MQKAHLQYVFLEACRSPPIAWENRQMAKNIGSILKSTPVADRKTQEHFDKAILTLSTGTCGNQERLSFRRREKMKAHALRNGNDYHAWLTHDDSGPELGKFSVAILLSTLRRLLKCLPGDAVINVEIKECPQRISH